MPQPFPIEYLVIPLVFLFVMFVMYLAVGERARREQHRLELQKAVLERVGSVKDLAEFLTTDQGERFLSSLAPAHFRIHHRGLWSVRIGIVILTVGLFLMIALHSLPLGGDPPRPLLLAVLLFIATGLGMLLSASVSFLLARRLGVNGQERSNRVTPRMPDARVLWLKSRLIQRWDAQRKVQLPMDVMEPFELIAGLAAAVLFLVWSLPSAFEWIPRLTF